MIHIHGEMKFPAPVGQPLYCTVDIDLQKAGANLQWSEPLPIVRVKYYTDEKDYVRAAIPLQYRDADSKKVLRFENDMSDVVFQQCIFVGIEFDANTIHYVNTAVSSENSATIAVARQMCLRVRAQPTNIRGKVFHCFNDMEVPLPTA